MKSSLVCKSVFRFSWRYSAHCPSVIPVKQAVGSRTSAVEYTAVSRCVGSARRIMRSSLPWDAVSLRFLCSL